MRPTRRAVLLAPAGLALARAAAAQPVETYEALLAEEHAAIHLYGVLAPRLPEPLRDAARAAYDDHRAHRDTLTALIKAAGGTPPPARVSYGLPAPAATATQARALAIRIEDALMVRWRALVGEVPPRDRRAFATAFADEAEHLVAYRLSAGVPIPQAAPPFPGR